MSLPFIIDEVNFEVLLKKLEANAHFKSGQPWEEMFDSVLKALSLMKNDLIKASLLVEGKRKNFADLYKDSPTDLYWMLSLLFTLRTVGMLYSKSIDIGRSDGNRSAHQQLLDHYVSVIQETINRKEELLVIFPPSSQPI